MKSTTILFVIAFLAFPLCESAARDSEDGSVQDYIRVYIAELESSGTLKLEKQKIPGNPIITELYKGEEFWPVWDNASNRKDLIEILEDSFFEGLNPEDYHISYIKEYDQRIERGERISMEDYAAADIIMTNAVLTYSFHMIQGKVHPAELDPVWNYSMRPMPDSAEFRIKYRLETQTLKEGVDNIRSELPMYHELRKWFAALDSMKKSGGGDTTHRVSWLATEIGRFIKGCGCSEKANGRIRI